MKCFFPKDILQWFFSKEGNKSDILKLEETKKNEHTRKCKKFNRFFGFSELFKTIYTKL